MKQMTPVEWLVDKICGTHTKPWQPEIDQALEMEKQQQVTKCDQMATNSSQLEISDEEIEEQSWGYREVTKDMEIPPNEDWSNGAKWYREQLKQRK